MKLQTISFLLFTVLYTVSIQSQTIIDKKAYEAMVDYCACEFSLAYTKSYAEGEKPSKTSDSIFEIEKESFEKEIAPEISNCNLENGIKQKKLIRILANNYYSKFANKINTVIDSIKKLHDNDLENSPKEIIVNGFFESQRLKSIVEKHTAVQNIKNVIDIELEDYLQKRQRQNENVNTKANTRNTSIQSASVIPTSLWLLVFLLPILSAGMIYFLLNKNIKGHEKDIRKNKNNINQLQNNVKTKDNMPNVNTESSTITTNHIENLKDNNEKLKVLENRIKSLEEKLIPAASSTVTTEIVNSETHDHIDDKLVASQESVPLESPNESVLYASRPDEKGVFPAQDLSPTDKKNMFYILKIDASSNKATFVFLNHGDSVKIAVDSALRYITPACESEGSVNRNAEKIITIKPGIAVKHENTWKIKQKALIRYE